MLRLATLSELESAYNGCKRLLFVHRQKSSNGDLKTKTASGQVRCGGTLRTYHLEVI